MDVIGVRPKALRLPIAIRAAILGAIASSLMGNAQCQDVPSIRTVNSDPAHHLTFPGLQLTLLQDGERVRPVAATVSSAAWKVLGPVRIGVAFETIAGKYGIRPAPSHSPVEFVGECTPLVLWHALGKISKTSLSCHACD